MRGPRSWTRSERASAVLAGFLGATLAIAAGLALDQIPIPVRLDEAADPMRASGHILSLRVDLRGDLARWREGEPGDELWFVAIADPSLPRGAVALFPEDADERYFARTATGAHRVDLVARRTNRGRAEAARRLGDPGAFVLEIGVRGRVFDPLWPMIIVFIGAVTGFMGARALRALEGEAPVLGADFHHVVVYATMCLGGASGLLAHGLVARAFAPPVFLLPALVGGGAMLALRAAPSISRWVGIGLR